MQGKNKSSYTAPTTNKKVDNKLIAEDYKKYEDKTTKKIKEGKKFLLFSQKKIQFFFVKKY